MKSVLLLFAILGLCLCTVQATTPAPTVGASQIVKAASSPASAQTTLPTVAGLSAETSSSAVPKAVAQISSPTPSLTVRATTPRPSATTAAPSTKATTPRPTAMPTTAAISTTGASGAAVSSPAAEPNLTLTAPTPWPNATTYDYSPTESRTPDIDPGMTPYSGATLLETIEPTPTWETPANIASATPTDASMAMPYFTGEAAQSPTFEIPPGAYGVEPTPSPTETVAPLPSSVPQDAAGSSFLPRWMSYLLFVILGIAGVAGLALVGSYLGSRSAGASVVAPVPPRSSMLRATEIPLLQPGAPEPTMEQQILLARIAGFDPQSMHVERLGRNLLRFEHEVQVGAQDSGIRLGHLILFSAIPSAPVPAPATAWARAHGFRILAVDGAGIALVMPTLSNGGHSVLGVLPVGEMVEGASPIPMPVLFTESGQGTPARRASPAGAGVL